MDKDSLSHTSRYCACHVVWIPKYRGRVPCGETGREVGETPGMPAGRTGGVEMVEGSACPDHTRICLRIAPKHSAGNVVGRSRGKSAIILRERHHERGALTGRDRTMWARGHHAGTVGPGESVTGGARPAAARREPHGVAGMPPTGA